MVSGPVLEAPAVVAGFDDVAVVREAVEQAVVILASPNTVAQSAKARLVVTMIDVRSYRRLIRWNSSWPPDCANGR